MIAATTATLATVAVSNFIFGYYFTFLFLWIDPFIAAMMAPMSRAGWSLSNLVLLALSVLLAAMLYSFKRPLFLLSLFLAVAATATAAVKDWSEGETILAALDSTIVFLLIGFGCLSLRHYSHISEFDHIIELRKQSYESLTPFKYLIFPILGLASVGGGVFAAAGCIFFATAIVGHAMKVGSTAIAKDIIDSAIYMGGLFSPFLILASTYWGVRFSRRLSQRRADDLIRSGKCAPLVFLRSFRDEELRVRPTSVFRWILRSFPTVEQAVLGTVSRLGPAVAIGLPGEILPPLGAMRAYYDDETWQTALLEWINRSNLIVAMVGTTHWAVWELSYLIQNGFAERLVLVVPPARSIAELTERHRSVLVATEGTIWSDVIRGMQPQGIRVIVFLPKGDVFAVRSTKGAETDYGFAIRVALSKMTFQS